jgi:hypothetical protein
VVVAGKRHVDRCAGFGLDRDRRGLDRARGRPSWIADNPLTDLSDFDPARLAGAVAEMTDDLLAAIGFDAVELEEMLEDLGWAGA